MKLIQTKNADVNYLAKVVTINDFEPHPNADKMKLAIIGGYKIAVSKDMNCGRYIYFPVGCQINADLLAYCNLFRHAEKNNNPEKTGFFEDTGRVLAIKLRQVPSEGFLLPYADLLNFFVDNLDVTLECPEEDMWFNAISHNDKEIIICKKYYIKPQWSKTNRQNYKNAVKLQKYDKVIPEQFCLHYDTVQIKKEPWCVNPQDVISISEKVHGTSGISAYVLCKKKLNPIIERIYKWIGISTVKYDYLYSSRTVIKNRYYNSEVGDGFYGTDVWKYADEIIRPHLTKGLSVYYEIIGYTDRGQYIQKGYDYGCEEPKEGEPFTYQKHFNVKVYRVTYTNVDGIVHEFSAKEVQQWCKVNDLMPVWELYYGYAKDLYPDIIVDSNWNRNFWDRLAEDKYFYMECNSPTCNNKVPHEGLVIKVEDSKSHAWKLKTFAFLGHSQKDESSDVDDI